MLALWSRNQHVLMRSRALNGNRAACSRGGQCFRPKVSSCVPLWTRSSEHSALNTWTLRMEFPCIINTYFCILCSAGHVGTHGLVSNSVKLQLFRANLNDLNDKKLLYFPNGYRCKHETTWNCKNTCEVSLDIFDKCDVTLQMSTLYPNSPHVRHNSYSSAMVRALEILFRKYYGIGSWNI